MDLRRSREGGGGGGRSVLVDQGSGKRVWTEVAGVCSALWCRNNWMAGGRNAHDTPYLACLSMGGEQCLWDNA